MSPPSARKGPKGIAILRAAAPWRTSRMVEGTSALIIAIIIATGTVRPSIAPSSRASLTSPIPMPAGYANAAMKRKRNAPQAPSAHSGEGWCAVCAASTIAAAGSTIRFGITCSSKSVTEIATSAAQNSEATAASAVSPNARTQAPMSSAVTSSTSGYFHGMDVPQCRQRARRSAQETIGMLSYHASGVSHAMHAEPGCTIERRSGTRAATTLRKLPMASPGTKAMAANAAVMLSLPSAFERRFLMTSVVDPSGHEARLPRRVSQHDVVLEVVAPDGCGGRPVDQQVNAQLAEAERERADVLEGNPAVRDGGVEHGRPCRLGAA